MRADEKNAMEAAVADEEAIHEAGLEGATLAARRSCNAPSGASQLVGLIVVNSAKDAEARRAS